MKKFLKISLLSIGIFLILIFSTYILIIINASKYKIDEKKLVNVDHSTVFLDSNGNELFSTSEGKEVAQFEEISDNVKNAFIAIEDKRFYSHKGVDYKALLRATLNNIKSFSFKEGGSTITQQLIKNTHLTNDKNIKRKIIEISLAKKLEKRYSKNEILEKYLNTVFFGENCYGIASASSHYFNKTPNELSVSESALLAGIVKAPSYYSINNNYDKTIERRNVVLKEMFNQNYITKEEYNFAKKEKIKVSSKKYDFFSLERILTAEVEKNNRLLPYTKNVIKTTINKYLQNNTQEIISNHNEQYDYTAVIIDKEFNVCAYASTCIIPLRQLGSTIKPLLVYGPAIENNVISPASIFLDEKTNFNGYSPSNFNDKYYGNVSAREALTKSLNVPFVKLINMVGIEKSAEYLKKMDFSIIDEDLTLPLSLGAKSKGETLLTK